MLHIFFLILKILGLILLAVIGVILLLLAALILLPARYIAAASWDGIMESVRWRVKFHWLLHLIAGEAVYENGRLIWRFRAAWKSSDSTGESEKSPPAAPDRKSPSKKKSDSSPGNVKKTETVLPEEKDRAVQKEKTEIPEEKAEKSPKTASGQADIRRIEAGKKAGKTASVQKTRKKAFRRKKKEKRSFSERIFAYWEKIKYTLKKIYDNIKLLTRKKEKLHRFLTNETHKNAFVKTVKELKRLLRSLRPGRLEGKIEFGFEDPAHTGYLLAGISMIYPMIGEFIDIRADFEHKVLKGSVLAAGKLRLLYLLIPAWNLFFDRDVKITYRHIKNFKL